MKKIIALLIAFVMVFSLAGCKQKSNRDANTIYIDFEIVDNGYGYKWLNDACREFEELVKTKDYGGGKKPGVVCKVKTVESLTDLQSMRRSGTEVFFGGGVASNLIRTGNLLDITDVVEEKNYRNDTVSIKDMMYEETVALNKVGDKFYTIPTYEVYSGMSYDKELFDREGLYFADPTSSDPTEPFTCPVTNMTVDFITPGGTNKSCGPDGVKGNYDDGMPSSMVELLQLYSYMSTNKGISPLQVPGKYLYEADFATEGLYTALLGREKARGTYDFTGEVDIVKSLNLNEDAFEGFNFGGAQFYKPSIVTKEISEETGYYTTWSIERYYALLFMDICRQLNWFAYGYDPDINTFTHQQAQYQFICSGYQNSQGYGAEVGTMATGSYWYNESLNSFTNFDNFYTLNPDCEHRNISWMPLPVNIFTSVTGVEGEEETPVPGYTESTKGEVQTISQAHANCLYFNDNVRQDAPTYAALKDWIRFFYSYEQLEKSTIRQGMRRALNYEVRDLEDITDPAEREELKQIMVDSSWMGFNSDGSVAWEGFYKQLSDYVEDSYLLRFAANNNTFLENQGANSIFKRGEQSRVCSGANKQYLRELIKDSTGYESAMHAFGTTMISFETWKNVYKGSKAISELAPLMDGGLPITYNSRLSELQ